MTSEQKKTDNNNNNKQDTHTPRNCHTCTYDIQKKWLLLSLRGLSVSSFRLKRMPKKYCKQNETQPKKNPTKHIIQTEEEEKKRCLKKRWSLRREAAAVDAAIAASSSLTHPLSHHRKHQARHQLLQEAQQQQQQARLHHLAQLLARKFQTRRRLQPSRYNRSLSTNSTRWRSTRHIRPSLCSTPSPGSLFRVPITAPHSAPSCSTTAIRTTASMSDASPRRRIRWSGGICRALAAQQGTEEEEGRLRRC